MSSSNLLPVYGYFNGLESSSSYNHHIVQLDSDAFQTTPPNDKLTATILSTRTHVRSRKMNIKPFDYINFDQHVPKEITFPGTASPKEIISLLENECEFPSEIGQCICLYLIISQMVFDEVKAIGCSSSSLQFPLKECLTPNGSTWWISAMPCPQFVEFEVDRPSVLKQIGIKIPPLPNGPLSVRQFSLSFMDPFDDKVFIEDDRIFETLDTERLQLFAVDPPIVLHGSEEKNPRFRVICKSTAVRFTESVGFFSIIFG